MSPPLTIALGALVLVGIAWLLVVYRRAQSRQRLLSEYITNNMPSGLVTVDADGFITGHNPASQNIYGYELSTGRPLADLVVESSRFASVLERCLGRGETFTRLEFNVPEPSGALKRIGVNLSPITSPSNQIDGAICLFSDLTEIVKLQEQIRLQENYAALGEMSAGIAHEFKNSLATISGYAQMLAKESDPDSVRSYASEGERETRSLATIVTDFLNFARPVDTTLQSIDLAELLREAVGELENLRPGEYTVSVEAPDSIVLRCDATLLKQAVMNVLINAVEALESSGTVAVALERVRGGKTIAVRVEDNGRGIEGDVFPKVFIPFFTTKTDGTGLGLPLVQKIVLAHGGRIEFERLDHGTRVSLLLPASRAADDPVVSSG